MGNALMLVPLLKTLTMTRKPLLCAFLFVAGIATGDLIFATMGQMTWLGFAWTESLLFAKCYAYFWLLDNFDSEPGIYWPVFVIGFLIMVLT
jgi:hypothetical protein